MQASTRPLNGKSRVILTLTLVVSTQGFIAGTCRPRLETSFDQGPCHLIRQRAGNVCSGTN